MGEPLGLACEDSAPSLPPSGGGGGNNTQDVPVLQARLTGRCPKGKCVFSVEVLSR